jgi:hypothetical protein
MPLRMKPNNTTLLPVGGRRLLGSSGCNPPTYYPSVGRWRKPSRTCFGGEVPERCTE